MGDSIDMAQDREQFFREAALTHHASVKRQY
jgi:hypothetical protein